MSGFPHKPDTTTIDRPDISPQETDSDLGHWRNRWSVPDRHAHLAKQQGALPLGDGTWLGSRRFDSSEEAERHAGRFIEYNRRHFDIGYLGTEYFPDY